VKFAALGGTPCFGGASGTGCPGSASIGLSAATYRTAKSSILTRRSGFMRHDLRQEPYAVTLHVRICAGGGGQPPSLPRPQFCRFDEQQAMGSLRAGRTGTRLRDSACSLGGGLASPGVI